MLHGVADAEYDVVGAANPDGAVGLEDALAAHQPFFIEFVVEFRAAGFVPIAFVDFDHFAGMAGDAAVREEVRRVGEDAIEATGVAVAGVDGVEEFEAVAVVEADEGRVRGVNELGSCELRSGRWRQAGSLSYGFD